MHYICFNLFQEEAWNHQCKRFADDIEGKLDRLELDPLKEWLESRLRALNEKLKKQNQAPVEWTEDDAAGIRRYVYRLIILIRPGGRGFFIFNSYLT